MIVAVPRLSGLSSDDKNLESFPIELAHRPSEARYTETDLEMPLDVWRSKLWS